jgi:putative endonuclease
LGEQLGRRYLAEKGMEIVATNVGTTTGEVDILAIDAGARVAVEVRARTGDGDPIDAIDIGKRAHVHALARRLGATRVDFLGIRLGRDHVDFHWVPG